MWNCVQNYIWRCQSCCNTVVVIRSHCDNPYTVKITFHYCGRLCQCLQIENCMEPAAKVICSHHAQMLFVQNQSSKGKVSIFKNGDMQFLTLFQWACPLQYGRYSHLEICKLWYFTIRWLISDLRSANAPNRQLRMVSTNNFCRNFFFFFSFVTICKHLQSLPNSGMLNNVQYNFVHCHLLYWWSSFFIIIVFNIDFRAIINWMNAMQWMNAKSESLGNVCLIRLCVLYLMIAIKHVTLLFL